MHSSFRLAAALLGLSLSAVVFNACAHGLAITAPVLDDTTLEHTALEFQARWQGSGLQEGALALNGAAPVLDARGAWYLQTLSDNDILLPPSRNGVLHGAVMAATPVPESSQYRLLLVGVALLLLCGGWRQAAPETPWAAIKVD